MAAGVCLMNSRSRAWSLVNRGDGVIEGALFISLPQGHEVEVSKLCQRERILLLTHDQHHERVGLDAALRPATRCGRWSFDKLGRTEKDLLRFGIESHGACAWLRLHWTGVFVVVGGFFVKDVQYAFAARKENQFRLAVEAA